MPSCGIWRSFRIGHPAPYQTIALYEGQGDAVVILSEPPPLLSPAQFAKTVKAIFGESLIELTYNRWPTGIDGWLEDAVLRVKLTDERKARVLGARNFESWSAPAGVVDRLRFLYRLMYRTSDGFWIDQLKADRGETKPITELRVPISDVAGWLANPDERWNPLSGEGTTLSSRDLYSAKSPGAFKAKSSLVSLVIPSGTHLDELMADFRRFAVASDLLIGAVGMKGGGLLLLGRSRQEDMETLPPLRFETLVGFARNRTDHLAQSYERQRIFAGKIRTGRLEGWDWAPILLSPQLEDSEFGTLLNLADQILKSWSQHGEVGYYAFNHGKPKIYPFGEIAASDYFGAKYESTSLLFNWNTEHFATLTTINGREFLTADRTGALSVIYRPSSLGNDNRAVDREGRMAMNEDADGRAKEARDYFAASGDPILVRVVQNVILCQAAQSLLKIGDPQELAHSSRSDDVVQVLQGRAKAWLVKIEDGESAVDPVTREKLRKLLNTPSFTNEKVALILASPQSVEQDLQRSLQRFRTSLADAKSMPVYLATADAKQRELFFSTCASVGGTIQGPKGSEECHWTEHSESGQAVFAAYDAYVDRLKLMVTEFSTVEERVVAQATELAELEKTYGSAIEIADRLARQSGHESLDEILTDVLNHTPESRTKGFIRTPTVVLSHNSADRDSVGGHNIDLVPSRGLVAPRIPASVVGKLNQHIVIEADLERPRPQVDALKAGRNGSLLDEIRDLSSKINSKPDLLAQVQVRAKKCQCDAVLSQGEDGEIYFARNAPPPIQQVIVGKSGAIDALTGPPAVRVVRFENFPDRTVQDISNSAALTMDDSGGTKLDRALDSVARLFGSADPGDRGISVRIERVGREAEFLHLSEDPGETALLTDPINWRNASVTEPTGEQWNQAFGVSARLDSASSNAVVVTFAKQSDGISRSLGVRVLMEPGRRTGVIARLRAVVEQWLGRQPIKAQPWADSLVELRNAIRLQLKPADLEFYYKRNQAKIRVSELRSLSELHGTPLAG
jgi:hypothetical protein